MNWKTPAILGGVLAVVYGASWGQAFSGWGFPGDTGWPDLDTLYSNSSAFWSPYDAVSSRTSINKLDIAYAQPLEQASVERTGPLPAPATETAALLQAYNAENPQQQNSGQAARSVTSTTGGGSNLVIIGGGIIGGYDRDSSSRRNSPSSTSGSSYSRSSTSSYGSYSSGGSVRSGSTSSRSYSSGGFSGGK